MQCVIQFENNNQMILTGIKEEMVSREEFFEKNPNFQLTFKGKNNLLVMPFDIKLMNSKIKFMSSNGFCYLKNTINKQVVLNLSIWENSSFIMGKNCSFNGFLNAIASENSNIIIGNQVMFSFGIWIRTSDVHVIMDIESQKIINHGKDVFVGDDVWIGQGASLLKGATIGSGSVLGYGSILTKELESNSVCSGTPAKVIKRNIIWDRQSMHNYSMNLKAKFEEKFEFDKKENYTNEKYQENIRQFGKYSKTVHQAQILEKLEIAELLLQEPLIIKEKRKSFLQKIFK